MARVKSQGLFGPAIETKERSAVAGDSVMRNKEDTAMSSLWKVFVIAPTALFALLITASLGLADQDGGGGFAARLRGYEEVVFGTGVGAVSTGASGTFRARVTEDSTAIEYELSYGGLEGTVTQAHIHFGQRRTQGGISVFLCQTADVPDPTGLAPVCPVSPPDGTVSVTGTLTAANVIGPVPQGIAAGEFEELLRAVRADVTYANVHSTLFPAGEIRGQIRPNGRNGNGRNEKDDD